MHRTAAPLEQIHYSPCRAAPPLLNPSARIRLCKFVRSIPSARATPDTFQLASSSARRI